MRAKPGTYLRRPATITIVLVLLLIVGFVRLRERASQVWREWFTKELPPPPASSALAFEESYLGPAAGRITAHRTRCVACHPRQEGLNAQAWQMLRERDRLPRAGWAAQSKVSARCGNCHVLPDPAALTWTSWSDVMSRMREVMHLRSVPPYSPAEWMDLTHFYYTFSPAVHRRLDPDPEPAESPVRFDASPLGTSPGHDARPGLGDVRIADIDRDTRLDVIVCDTEASTVNWMRRRDGQWHEVVIATLPHPARVKVLGAGPGEPSHLVVACLGTMRPVDDLVGSVVLLVNDGASRFTPVPLLGEVSRVADVTPGDLDGDGDEDLVVAAYGYLSQGGLGWLEKQSGTYIYRPIIQKTGAMQTELADLNGDGRPDIVALFGQEHEEVTVFIQEEQMGFVPRILFKAATPSFGSSSFALIDLDQDGDVDIVLTNGDNMDLPNVVPRPYHGVQWLENRGGLEFIWHDLYRFYGAYRAVAGDLNRDGRPDLVVASLFHDWSEPDRASLIWLENLGQQLFRARGMGREPIHLVAAALADLDGDGWDDVVTSSLNAFPPFERMGRVTQWRNRGRQQGTPVTLPAIE